MKSVKRVHNSIIQGKCEKVLNSFLNNSIDLVVTDPPYNLKQNYPNEDLTEEKYKEFNLKWLKEAYRVLKEGRLCYITSSQKTIFNFKDIIDETDFNFIQLLIWKYPNTIPSSKKPNYKWTMTYQPVFYLSKGTPELDVYGKAFDLDLERRDVWKITQCQSNYKNPAIKKIHPAQKPEELYDRIIKTSSKEGEVILDPFAGSGTCIASAIKNNRKFIGIELKKEYIDMIKSRVLEECNVKVDIKEIT